MISFPSLKARLVLLMMLFCRLSAGAQFENEDKVFQKIYDRYLLMLDSGDVKALPVTIELEKYARAKSNDYLLGEALRFKGNVLFNMGGIFEPLDINTEQLKLARKENDRNQLFNALRFRTDLYNVLKDFRSAKQSLMEAKKYLDHNSDDENLDYLCSALDLNYAMGEYQTAIDNGEKAIRIAKKVDDPSLQNFAVYFMGCAYGKLNQGAKAVECLQKSISLSEMLTDTNVLLSAYSSIAEVYIDCFKNADKGLYYLELERKMADISNIHFQQYELYESYSKAWELKGNYQKALDYRRKAEADKERELDHERQRELRDLDQRDRTKEKEQNIASLERKQRSQKELLESQRQTAVFAFIGLGLMVVITVVGAFAYRNSRRHSSYLAQDKERKTLLLQEVHHRVNNSLQMTSALLSMQSAAATSEETKDALRLTEARIHSMASLHALLNEDTAAGLTVSMKEYLHRLLDFHRSVLEAGEKVELVTAIDDVELPSAMALPVALCMNELVTNAVKYAFPGQREGRIQVKLHQEGEEWVLTVCDNGKGFSENEHAVGTGLGGDIVKILVSQLKGRLEVESNAGACFRLYFGTGTKQTVIARD